MLRRFGRRQDLRQPFAALGDQGVPAAHAEGLASHFSTADPRELVRVNPRLPAERLGLSEREALRALVVAVHAGLLDLHWEVGCPACGALNHRGHSLGALRHETECDACHTRFVGHLDQEVGVSFSLHQRLRPRGATFDPAYRAQVDARLGPTPGHALLLLPEFQRLFPQQRLLPDESLDVTRAALLFTDLAGSTAIYARRGDPRAYHLVRLHFDELFRVADACEGIMVKTIGDAVMAAFQTPAQALRAGLEMQAAVAQLNERAALQGDEQLILKVGLHSGPCLSVTLNDRCDYFGTTVNLAARVQALSSGHDLVFTDAFYADPEAAALLGGRALTSASVTLKGIAAPVRVHRLVQG